MQVKIWLVNGESGLNTKKPDPKTLFAAGSRKRIIIPLASLLTPCPGGCAAKNPVDTTRRCEDGVSFQNPQSNEMTVLSLVHESYRAGSFRRQPERNDRTSESLCRRWGFQFQLELNTNKRKHKVSECIKVFLPLPVSEPIYILWRSRPLIEVGKRLNKWTNNPKRKKSVILTTRISNHSIFFGKQAMGLQSKRIGDNCSSGCHIPCVHKF